jgi:hypothetical protein
MESEFKQNSDSLLYVYIFSSQYDDFHALVHMRRTVIRTLCGGAVAQWHRRREAAAAQHEARLIAMPLDIRNVFSECT